MGCLAYILFLGLFSQAELGHPFKISAFELNMKLPAVSLAKRIDLMIRNPKKADIAFLYAQLGNYQEGDFAENDARGDFYAYAITPQGEIDGGQIARHSHFGIGNLVSRQKIADMSVIALNPVVRLPMEIMYPEGEIKGVISINKYRMEMGACEALQEISYKWRWTGEELSQIADAVEKYAGINGIKLGPRPSIDMAAINEYNKHVPLYWRTWNNEFYEKYYPNVDHPELISKDLYRLYGSDFWDGRGILIGIKCYYPESENYTGCAASVSEMQKVWEKEHGPGASPLDKTIVHKKPGCSSSSEPFLNFLHALVLAGAFLAWRKRRPGVGRGGLTLGVARVLKP